MIISTIAYDCSSGISHLAKMFYDHGIINKVLRVPHPHYRSNNWYPPSALTNPRGLMKESNVLLLFETAVGNTWKYVLMAKANRVKVVLVPMYEYTPYPTPVVPDLVLAPSLLDKDYYTSPSWATSNNTKYRCELITIPTDSKVTPWVKRTEARVFVHNAGHGQHDYAKGTPAVLEAIRGVKSPAKFIIRGQPGENRIVRLFDQYRGYDPRVEFVLADVPYRELFATGDVFLNAEEFNGLSLPLQEAFASGMGVITTDRYPANTWLPYEGLIQPATIRPYRIPGGSGLCIDRCHIPSASITEKIEGWYGKDLSELSERGREYAEANSWEVWGPKIRKLLEEL